MTESNHREALATIIPDPKVPNCDYEECERNRELVTIDPDDQLLDQKTLCWDHLIEYLQGIA